MATPPPQRTIGQLVADAIRLYGHRFFRSLPLGIPPAILALLPGTLSYAVWLPLMITVGGLLASVSYVGGTAVAAGIRIDRQALVALGAGVIAFAPVPVLVPLILPPLAWLALVGLVVPVVLVERVGIASGFRRAVELARADYIHALGSLATLVIVTLLTQGVLFFLLRGAGEQTIRISSFLAIVVVSPLLFLGSALLYFDQVSRHHGGHGSAVPRR